MDLVESLDEYDRAAVIKFSDLAVHLQSLTNDRELVKNALSSSFLNGGTNISDGIRKAIEEFDNNGGNNHKIIILLSDGDSTNGFDNSLLTQASGKNITIFTVGLGSGINPGLLTQIAHDTGGQYFQATDAGHLTDAFQNMRKAFEDLREPKQIINWVLTKDLEVDKLVLQENMKLDLNGYDLKVTGD